MNDHKDTLHNEERQALIEWKKVAVKRLKAFAAYHETKAEQTQVELDNLIKGISILDEGRPGCW